jgi:hypothetical protein
LLVSRTPTLKRGANNHCAYGAGDGPLTTRKMFEVSDRDEEVSLSSCFPRSQNRDLGRPALVQLQTVRGFCVFTVYVEWNSCFPTLSRKKRGKGWGTHTVLIDTAQSSSCGAEKMQMQVLRLAALAQDDSFDFQLLSENALQIQMQVLRPASLAQDDCFVEM